jgi:hypothetical protein
LVIARLEQEPAGHLPQTGAAHDLTRRVYHLRHRLLV